MAGDDSQDTDISGDNFQSKHDQPMKYAALLPTGKSNE
jgi:hypothetical protein